MRRAANCKREAQASASVEATNADRRRRSARGGDSEIKKRGPKLATAPRPPQSRPRATDPPPARRGPSKRPRTTDPPRPDATENTVKRCRARGLAFLSTMEMPEFKLILVGDGGVGKTTFVNNTASSRSLLRDAGCVLGAPAWSSTVPKRRSCSSSTTGTPPTISARRCRGRRSRRRHEPRPGSNSTSGTRPSASRSFAQEVFRDGYYIQGQCAIVMFDVTSASPIRTCRTGTAT